MSNQIEIQRFSVKSCGKFFALLHLAIGVIAGFFMAIVGIIDASTAAPELGVPGMSQALIGGFLMVTIAPIVYAVLGFTLGAVIAGVYNFAAKQFGGIIFTVK